MKLTKNQAIQLANFGYHLRKAVENLEALTKPLTGEVEGGEGSTAEEKPASGKGKKPADKPATGKGKGKKQEEMEEVESQFSDDPADFEEEVAEASGDDDNFDFDNAEVEEEPEHTEADVRTAMTAYAKKHSKDKALAVLGKFAKSKKVADVPPAKYGALIDALKVK